jgi:hypothetical protein
VTYDATAAEREHMGRVAALGCIVCRKLFSACSPAEVHHIREGTGNGRASHYDTLPLCYLHHRGADGIHNIGTKRWHRRFWTELELLAEVWALLEARHGCSPPADSRLAR